MPQITYTRAALVAEVRQWLATPYRHQASVKGVGADCLGLVRGVWRAFYGTEPARLPAYTPDWAEAGGAEQLAEAGRAHLVAVDPADALPGDVLLFRFAANAPAKHAGILSAGTAHAGLFIHAYELSAVTETRLAPWWRRRLAFVFRFPDVSE
ncbi:NlpC/P60 family putative phage cell wall peptidase [Breoghania corrubedonensis]|uniref:NlpC/P60 family putative phage cell wall peptidase n=2 Tax=Breoghania corrubedonensis TaxID=665038 RepID=A0A2T5V1L4_9HYPH|nr:NlpC/P60 family protein [Breoghania corrubedonensis]PTW57647.1 NlpC/P60 family putative phage cell wall peptidase [Breoghania corrubedonensis]